MTQHIQWKCPCVLPSTAPCPFATHAFHMCSAHAWTEDTAGMYITQDACTCMYMYVTAPEGKCCPVWVLDVTIQHREPSLYGNLAYT